jgi:hypothetical protein
VGGSREARPWLGLGAASGAVIGLGN